MGSGLTDAAAVVMDDPAVRVDAVTVRYRRRVALDRVSLSLGLGVHGLLGPNGAGKTTLMRVLATLVAPASGTVELLGRPADSPRDRVEIRRGLGYLPQAFGYYPRFTVREFVEYFAWLKQIPGPQVSDAVDHAIERVGLTDRAGDKLKSLSGGMLRRAGIAQAIVNNPRLLLMDEPTAGLDPEQRVEFRSLVAGLGESAAVIISTHLVEDVASACRDVAILTEGRVAYRGTATELAALGEEPARGDTDEKPAGDDVSDGSSGDAPSAGQSPIERGYSAALRLHRAREKAAS